MPGIDNISRNIAANIPATEAHLNSVSPATGYKVTLAVSCVAVGALLGQMAISWTMLVGTAPVFLATLFLGMICGISVARQADAWLCRQASLRLRTGESEFSGSRLLYFLAVMMTLVILGLTWFIAVILPWFFQLTCQYFLPAVTSMTGPMTVGSWDIGLAMMLPGLLICGMTLLAGLWLTVLRVIVVKRISLMQHQAASCDLPGSNNVVTNFSHLNARYSSSTLLLWTSIGACLLLLHAPFAFPVAVTVSVCLLVSLLLACAVRPLTLSQAAAQHVTTRTADSAAKNRPVDSMAIDRRGDETVPALVLAAMQSFASGLVCWSALGLLSQLMDFSWPAVLMSLVISLSAYWLMGRRPLARRISAAGLNIAGLVAFSTMPLAMPWLLDWNLTLKSSAAPVLWTVLLQAVQIATVLLFGCWLMSVENSWVGRSSRLSAAAESNAMALQNSRTQGPRFLIRSEPATLIAWTLGFLAFQGLREYGLGTIPVLTSAVIVLAVSQVLKLWTKQPSHRTRIAAGLTCVLVILPLCGFSLLARQDTDSGNGSILATNAAARASRMMFSDRTVTARQLGLPDDLIPHSDAARLIHQHTNHRGSLQIWRRSSQTLEFRRDGRLLGQVSSNTELTPQPIEEILPAILPLVVHNQPNRILVLGDDTGSCLKVCSHFPVQRILAIRDDADLTDMARRFTWTSASQLDTTRVEDDDRILICHTSPAIALNQQPEVPFDVLIDAQPATLTPTQAGQFSEQFYQAARTQLNTDGVFCQRVRVQHLGPGIIRQMLSTVRTAFDHVVAVQTIPGEFILLASSTPKGLLQEHLLRRLELDYVRMEIATAGWDWSQVAILPMLDVNDPVGLFGNASRPKALSIADNHLALQIPLELQRHRHWQQQMHAAFAASQIRIGEAVPMGESQHEVKRRLTALSQQVEILAGMPDEPWTYRRSLRMEMQRNARPPREIVRNGKITRVTHPTDQYHQDYFQSLGKSLQRVLTGDRRLSAFAVMNDFTQTCEPLVSLFAHYEIVRLHELAKHPAPAEEFRHRLHTVYFTEPSDASVRPVVAAMKQLVEQPELIATDADRYDQLNALLQKLIERWEARTAWEPRSAVRVQNDVEQSVHETHRALEMMEQLAEVAGVSRTDFLLRRRFIHSALVGPLRTYRDDVLAHRMKSTKPVTTGDEDPDDVPLLISSDQQAVSEEIPTN